MNVRHDLTKVVRRYLDAIGQLTLAGALCISLPVFADDTAYVLQYEIRFGRQQTTSNVFLAFQPRSGFDRFDPQYSNRGTGLPTMRDRSPRLSLSEAEEESDGNKSDSRCGGFCVLLGLAVIGGSIWALQEEGQLEECLVEGLVTGYC